MSSAYRFGRRVALPSTRQITHELRQMMAAERIRQLEAELRAVTGGAAPIKASPVSLISDGSFPVAV